MTDHKFQIFDVLNHLSKKNIKFFDDLSEEDLKAIQPYVLIRWLSGSSNPIQVLLLNEIANQYVFSLQQHKPLLIKLLLSCTSGNTQRYQWSSMAKNANGSFPAACGVVKQYFGYSTKEAKQALPLLTNDDIMQFAGDIGLQKEDVVKLRTELKKR